jgi:hypothetical protein
MMGNWGKRIEKGEGFFARFRLYGVGEVACRQGTGCNDRRTIGQRVNPFPRQYYVGVRFDGSGDRRRIAIPINRERRARRHTVAVRAGHDQRIQGAQFRMKQPDRVGVRIVRPEAV